MPAKSSSSIRRVRRNAYRTGRVLGGAQALEDGHLIEWAARQGILSALFRTLGRSQRRGRRG
jgi:hypothetical protein